MNTKRRSVAWAAAVFCVTASAFAQSTTAPVGAFKITETRLGTFNEQLLDPIFSRDGQHVAYITPLDQSFVVLDGAPGPEFDQIVKGTLLFSPDGTRLAYVAKKGKKCLVVLDGHDDPQFDTVLADSMRFSADGKHLAYIAADGAAQASSAIAPPNNVGVDDLLTQMRLRRLQELGFNPGPSVDAAAALKGIRWHLVADGKVSPDLDQIAGNSLIFSADGKRMAYFTVMGNGWSAVVDGQAGPSLEKIDMEDLIFSPDSKHVAYLAIRTSGWSVVVDGKVEPPYDGIEYPAFVGDGDHIVYVARKGGKSFVVLDGQEGPQYDDIDNLDCRRSHDMAYMARLGTKWVVVIDGKADREYETPVEPPVSFVRSPDGMHLAYVVSRNPKSVLVVDAKEVGEYDRIGEPLFSPDGKRMAFTATNGANSFAVVDGRSELEFDAVEALRFSSDSKHWSYAAKKGQMEYAVVDGKVGPAYMGEFSQPPTFSPDGQRIAYVAMDSTKPLAVIDGQPGTVYDQIGRGAAIDFPDGHGTTHLDTPNPLLFSPGSKHTAYAARIGPTWRLVVDGQPGAPYDMIEQNSPIFRPDGTLDCLAVKDHTLYRIQYVPVH